MTTIFRIPLAVAVIVCCTAGISRADDNNDIKAAGKSFSAAMDKGDSAEARAYVYCDENAGKAVDAAIDLYLARKQLTSAAVAKFGDDGNNIAGDNKGPKSPVDLQNSFDDAEIELHGDMAVVSSKGGKTVNFKKDAGQWKIDFSDFGNNPQTVMSVPIIEKMVAAMTETAGEISDGKYQSVNEARTAMGMKMASALGIPAGARPPQR